MLVNLVPEFFALLDAPDPESAYQRYLEAHAPLLAAYWRNYVLDLESPHAGEVITAAIQADRSDLRALLNQVDLVRMAEDTMARAAERLQVDREIDVVLMVGVGAANAGELVLNGTGVVVICVEHFTGRANPSAWALGLSPGLLPLWIAHEMAHCVRYTSPASESELRRLVADTGGYDYWETGSRVSLRELLINEGLAVHAAQAVVPGLAAADYFGYPRRQYTRLRELEAFLRRSVRDELNQSGLGLRLRYLSGGTSPAARLVQGKVVPERSGYYLGYRMSEALVQELGIARALRAPARAFEAAERAAMGIRTA